MKVGIAIAVAVVAFGGARFARIAANAKSHEMKGSQPYAPSASSAPFLSLGYREAFADAMFVRLRGYFGGSETTPEGVASLCEAIVALDPRFHRTYDYCGGALSFFSLTQQSPNQVVLLRAIGLLERGAQEFPKDWRIPNLAGQIYTQDLVTNNPQQRREWDEKGLLLIESAIRKPGAPAQLQDWAAVMRTKYGQQQRAIRDLREILLVTTDAKARKTLIDRLAKLQEKNADEIASEIFVARQLFEREWKQNRSAIPATWYVLLGVRPADSFDVTALATGGRELVPRSGYEDLEPLYQD